MVDSGTPESNGSIAEQQPLTLQLAKESQSMISKLKQLKLDDPSAPGMAVFGENGSQIAILHGSIPVQGQEETAKEKHLVISPKGFFLAEGRSNREPNEDELYLTLKDIGKKGQPPEVSIDDQEDNLKINTVDAGGTLGRFEKFGIKRVDSNPEEFTKIVKSAIENSRKIAQKPLQEEIARAKAGNAMLDNMIQQEKSTSSPLPGPTI